MLRAPWSREGSPLPCPTRFSKRHSVKPSCLLAQAPVGSLNLDSLAKDLAITKPIAENILGYLEDAMAIFRLANCTGSVCKVKKGYFLDDALPAGPAP